MAKMDLLIGELKSITNEHGKKLDDISQKLDKQNYILAENTGSLKEHMMQTRILKEEQAEFRAQLKPVQDHVEHVKALVKVAKWLVPLIGVPEAIYCSIQIMEWMMKHFPH